MATDPSVRQGVRAVATTTTDPQRNEKRALAARGAAGALALSVLALVVQAAATATPTWGYYSNDHNVAVWVAGLAAAGASALLAILVALAVLQLAMASSAKRVVISYSTAVIGKVALATLSTALSIVAESLFALQTDDRANSYVVTRGEAFYMQLAAIVLNFGVLVSSIYEGIYARRGGDPTKIRVVTDPRAATINNPGYREHHQPTNGGTISMTDASGKPYVGGAGNGSMASVATSGSVASTASPLRSSLKKPKTLGIHNPGFSAHSPTLSRNGSQKKVRIQTHSTEV
ncbi:uncharacterized protein LOC105192099 isoform X2 [Harpegnathos saltator]|uniref:uncharacterized protein LOC105192099 isoform X2 n=1 Tax=Harpegnathos saltator TaxID=610380 RepID=UPI000DBEE6FB|nr:uncharacterized protein LOC105192099 isoform X2 [Harpegnathos saltator]